MSVAHPSPDGVIVRCFRLQNRSCLRVLGIKLIHMQVSPSHILPSSPAPRHAWPHRSLLSPHQGLRALGAGRDSRGCVLQPLWPHARTSTTRSYDLRPACGDMPIGGAGDDTPSDASCCNRHPRGLETSQTGGATNIRWCWRATPSDVASSSYACWN